MKETPAREQRNLDLVRVKSARPVSGFFYVVLYTRLHPIRPADSSNITYAFNDHIETLLLTPTTPQLRIWTAKLYPLTLFFFSLLVIQTIFAMGRCCSLSTRSTRRNPSA